MASVDGRWSPRTAMRPSANVLLPPNVRALGSAARRGEQNRAPPAFVNPRPSRKELSTVARSAPFENASTLA